MRYRAEIDGLRAVAVLPVILFHGGIAGFDGGFVGVDVFFVISGYLITSIILGDLERGRFSIRQFYERRARRILPALFAMLAVCVPLAHAWMVPEQFREFSRAVISVALFVSNVFFWRNTDYFAPRAEENPLLHTWSLAIEEQFYIVFPVLMLLLWRAGRARVFWIVVLLTAGSLALAEYGSRAHPTAAFYLLPTRAWELGVGAICAFLLHGRTRRERPFLALAGVGLIAVTVLTFDATTPFPSLLALLPVGGTALVILYGGTSGIAGRLLAAAPVVGIGLVSYSAYLWHQPLFAFARIRFVEPPGAELMLLLAAASLGLAWASWRFVEQPFRRRPQPVLPRRGAVFVASAGGLGLFAGFGAWGEASEGRRALWEALNPDRVGVYALYEAAREIRGRYLDDGACRFNQREWSAATGSRLAACAEAHGPGLAILGDSHSIDLFNGLYAVSGEPFLVGFTSNCRPGTPRPECPYDAVAAFVAANPGVLGAAIYTEAGFRHVLPADGRESGRDIFEQVPEAAPIGDGLVVVGPEPATIAYLEGLAAQIPVTWLGPRIEPHISLDHMLALGCDHPYSLRPGLEELFGEIEAAVRAETTGSPVAFVSQIEAVDLTLPEDFMDCEALHWQDGDHWSATGAERFAARLLDRLPARAPSDRGS